MEREWLQNLSRVERKHFAVIMMAVENCTQQLTILRYTKGHTQETDHISANILDVVKLLQQGMD